MSTAPRAGDSTSENDAATPTANPSAGPKEGKSATHPRPVEIAFALGWHVAEIVNMQNDPPQRSSMLRQVSNLDFDDRVDLLCRQITAESLSLPLASRESLPSFEKDEVLAQVRAFQSAESVSTSASDGQTSVTGPLAFLSERHVKILTALTASSFEIGKAYSLGVALGETVSSAYDAAKAGNGVAAQRWGELFSESRIALLAGQLRDLKSNFAPYAVDPVASTLTDWATWVRSPTRSRPADPAADGKNWIGIAQTDFYPQALIWRALLSGEKLPTDTLKVGDYVGAFRHLVSTYGEVAKGVVTKTLVVAVGLVAGLLLAGVVLLALLHALSGAATLLVGLLGVLGLSGATAAAVVRKGLNQAEASLWDAEIAAAVAVAIDRVPEQIPNSSVKGLRSGGMVRKRRPLEVVDSRPQSAGQPAGQPTPQPTPLPGGEQPPSEN